MSDPGYSPAPLAAPAEDAESDEFPLWWLVVGCVLALIGAGLVAFVLLTGEDEKKGPEYPSAWDPRVAPYVAIVEKQRDLRFEHPVAVRFLEPKAFEKEVTADKKDLDADEREEIERAAALLRAIGLLTGDVDLFDAFNDASGSGTLAYYDPEDERITIRGSRLTLGSRPTLVHELTHALQDQHFDIGDRLETLREQAEDGDDGASAELEVFDAIVEGDAERVSTLYLESRPAKQKAAIEAAVTKEQAAQGESLDDVPKVVLSIIGAPYALGEAMVQTVAADGGNSAVDDLFRDSPVHASALLDPFEALSDERGADPLKVPGLEEGEKDLDDDGEFGAITWYLMLAERLPLLDALAAADGWSADAYVSFERDAVTCARMAYAGDGAAATTRMYQSLRRWIAAAPGTPSKVRRDGDELVFETCDPGKASRVGKAASIQALGLVASRTYLGAGLLRSGAPTALARCLAGRLIEEYSLAQLSNPRFGVDDPAVKARVQQLALGCR